MPILTGALPPARLESTRLHPGRTCPLPSSQHSIQDKSADEPLFSNAQWRVHCVQNEMNLTDDAEKRMLYNMGFLKTGNTNSARYRLIGPQPSVAASSFCTGIHLYKSHTGFTFPCPTVPPAPRTSFITSIRLLMSLNDTSSPNCLKIRHHPSTAITHSDKEAPKKSQHQAVSDGSWHGEIWSWATREANCR